MVAAAPVTVTDIAGNIDRQLTFMDIEIEQKCYPHLKPKHGWLEKAMSYNPYAVGLLTITSGRITLADEHGHTFRSLGPTMITAAQLGIYRSTTHGFGNGIRLEDRLTVNLNLTTTSGTYQLLNDDLTVIPVLLTWLASFGIPVTDPLHLKRLPADFDWQQVTAAEIAKWSVSTPYAAQMTTLGARNRH